MLARGPQAGATPKKDALALLPTATRCMKVHTAAGIGYVIELPNGRRVASAGSARKAWAVALEWAELNQER